MSLAMSFVSFFVCIYLGRFLSRLNAFSFLGKRQGRSVSIDGLRGFLSIAVFFHHFAITYYWKESGVWQSPSEVLYKNYGKVGVAIFFMITGFLFLNKIHNSDDKIDWVKFFISRVFRIYPLFLSTVLLIAIFSFDDTSYIMNYSFFDVMKQVFLWVIFQGGGINGSESTHLMLAGVEWTLKYEWGFYFILPIMYILHRKIGSCLVYLSLAVAIYYYIFPRSFFCYPALNFNTQYFVLFAIGGCVSHLAHVMKGRYAKLIRSNYVSVLTLILLWFCLFYPGTLNRVHVVMISLFFMLVALGNDMFGIFRLKSAILLGEISYSLYLLHGLLLYLMFTKFRVIDVSEISPGIYSLLMPVICIFLVLISSVTYLYVERKGAGVGRRISLLKVG